jgi:23S rRNA pseudouridine1911/1915/1917 synthase
MSTNFEPFFTVVFEDNHLLIVNKVAGVLVQGDATEDKCLADYAKAYLKEKYQKQGNVFCGVVHRLDRPVSGLVILAKTSKALERMNEIFRENAISKTYWTLVLQKPKNNQDTLINWLKKDTKKYFSIAYNQEVKDSQRAELSFHVLKDFGNETLLEVKLVTGRFHQIRSQLSKIGSKIKGDLKYGAAFPNADASICLHARKIQFIHPIKNEPMEIIAPLPRKEFWKNALEFQL